MSVVSIRARVEALESKAGTGVQVLVRRDQSPQKWAAEKKRAEAESALVIHVNRRPATKGGRFVPEKCQ